jgi:hypothetical protein
MKNGALEKLCSLDFHFKNVKERFEKLGLDELTKEIRPGNRRKEIATGKPQGIESW